MSDDQPNLNTLPDTLPDGLPDIGHAPQSDPDPLAAVIADVPNQVDALAAQTKQQLVDAYNRGYKAAWSGLLGLTPRQFFKALGTKGVAFLVRGGALRKFVNEQYPDAGLLGIPPNYVLTPAADGSVDVTEK